MSSAAGPRDITLHIPAISFGHLHQQQRISDDEMNSLYKTYQDYFEVKEDTISPVNNETSSPSDLRILGSVPPATPQHQSPKDETTPTNIGPFFFVLSASSPLATQTPETRFISISPDITEDIPQSLSQLLPQPSTSLLEVITGSNSRASLGPGIPDDHGSSMMVSEPRAGSRLRPQLSHLQLRDNTASRLTAQAVIEPSNPPTSAVAEVAPFLPSPSLEPNPLCWSHPGPKQDFDARVTYPSPNSTLLGHRPRGARSMDLSPRQPVTTRGHIRGLSSPFRCLSSLLLHHHLLQVPLRLLIVIFKALHFNA